MSTLRKRSDGRYEVADSFEADAAHGCERDHWCILSDGHEGNCNEDREVWVGADVEYA